MLIRFNVKNFLSFNERDDGRTEEFSMISGKVRNKKEHIYDDGKIKLLKFAAVYGANAAGKSNFVKAMDFMRHTVTMGLPEGYTEKYCKVNPENKVKPSYFELEIMLNGKYYAYGFEVALTLGRFLSEWLVELHTDNSEKVIFERNIAEGTYILGADLKQKGLYEKMDIYAGDVCDDHTALFLSIMNRNKKNIYQKYEKAHILQEVFLWIKDTLDINYPNQPDSDYSYFLEGKNIKEVSAMLSAFGTGITDFELVDAPFQDTMGRLPKKTQQKIVADIELASAGIKIAQIEGRGSQDEELFYRRMLTYYGKIQEIIKMKDFTHIIKNGTNFFVVSFDDNNQIRCQEIEFAHGDKDVLFRLSEESDGTVRILDLLEILLAGEGKTFVIDELDRCLHPSITYKFVELFLQVAAEKNIQLIATTHESRLMDFDILRRDEIWFVNKKNNGVSDIYSLEEYNARFDQKIDKAYLEGRYGGVPIFSTVFPVKEE